MNNQHLSSGDLIADRRAEYARMLADSGEYMAAAELMEQALELAPGWPAGWFMAGEFWEKASVTGSAAAAFKKVLANSPEDIFGASLKLSLLGEVDTPNQPPVAYVEQLFDDYADHFEESLIERLHYRVPERLAAMLADKTGGRFDCTIDLGCGTGLFGEEIRPKTARLEGFDLSLNMLAKAGEKGIYDHLAQADLSLGIDEARFFGDGLESNRADLVAAADVVMYLGDLAPLFQVARRLMHPLGYFAFSAEFAPENHDYVLQPSMRYAHSPDYVADLVATHGFRLVSSEKLVIRMDAGEPVNGILFLSQNMANA